jgi:glucose/arabinose dehydrogenase
VVGSLSQPCGLAFLPDGRMLVVEQKTFAVRIVVNGVATTILTVPEVNGSGNERGLLGVAVDPQWPTRPFIYLMHNRTPGLVNYIVRCQGRGRPDRIRPRRR